MIGDGFEDRGRIESAEDRLCDLEQISAALKLALQALRCVRVGHRLRSEARIDDQQAKVVVAELVQPEL